MTSAGAATEPTDGVTQELATQASRLHFGMLDAGAVACATDLVVDHIGVSLRGWHAPWTRMLRDTLIDEGATPVASLYDGRRSSARNAALGNGAAGHALELDDTHDRSLTHPGTVVIPAALAVGEALGRSGPRVLQAIVAGYEVQCRLGMLLGQRLIERGMHPTATLGVFGAAAAAGNLHGLSPRQMLHAFGVAASMSAGLMQFSQDSEGTMVKRLYGGLPAERGVLAAALAARGFSGPGAAVEGRYGIAAMLAGTSLSALPVADTGFEVSRVSIKLYPCCKNFHALLEAIGTLRTRRPWRADQLAKVHVFGPRAMVEHHLECRPRSTMAAQYSLPYATAVGLIGDPHTPASFEEAARDRPDLLALAALVVPHIDAELSALFPAHFGGAVRIEFTDGTVDEERVVDCRGTPVRPLASPDIDAKFRTLTDGLLSAGRQAALLDGVRALATAPTLAAFTAGLQDRTQRSVPPDHAMP